MDQLGTVTKGQIINTEENYYVCVCNKWDTHIELKVVMTLHMTQHQNYVMTMQYKIKQH